MVHSFVLPDLYTCKRNTEKKNTLSSPCLYPSIVLFFLKSVTTKSIKCKKKKPYKTTCTTAFMKWHCDVREGLKK